MNIWNHLHENNSVYNECDDDDNICNDNHDDNAYNFLNHYHYGWE